MLLQSQYYCVSRNCAEQEAVTYLTERMLAQNHSAGTNHSRKDKHHAEPSQGIESEDDGERKQRSCHASDGCGVCGYLPPDVYHGTENLDDQRRYENVAHKVRDVYLMHHIIAHEVAHYGDKIRYDATLLLAQLNERPTVVMTIEMDEQRGHEDGEGVDKKQNGELVCPRHQTEIAEREEGYQSDERQIEWRECHAQYSRCEDNVLFFHA